MNNSEILKLIKDNYDIKYVQELSITLKDVFKGLYKKQSYIIFLSAHSLNNYKLIDKNKIILQKIWTFNHIYGILLAHKWLCCAFLHIIIMLLSSNKKASDSHYKRNLKKKRFRLWQELKKAAIPATTVNLKKKLESKL